MDQVFGLNGKHILITGASSGIGRACAILAADMGATVSLVARNEERLEQVVRELNGQGKWYSYDLADVKGIENLVKQIVEDQGKLDGMMYCAGDCLRAPLGACKPDTIMKSMNVNYFAFVEMMRCVSKKRNCNDGASFIAMSSASSLRGEKGLLGLCASKSAMNSAVKCAALELAPRKIRVNAIASAYVMESRLISETLDIFGENVVEENIATLQPLGAGKPQDVANVAVFLLSDASCYITGTVMIADGGYMA